jgi:HAD superfamily hydrolase (TIGR01509 family)
VNPIFGIRLLCLDAGNTVIFLDHARIAAWLGEQGFDVTARALIDAEGKAKRFQEEGALTTVPWDGKSLPGARGWGGMIGTMIREAGVAEGKLVGLLPRLWAEHEKKNLYSLVPEGLGVALDAVRERGVKVAVVSNSEGMLEPLFVELGIRRHFDLIADSGRLGFEKPDPRIFEYALGAFGVRAEDALHLGDSIATDVLGAKRAKLRVMLVDPYGHCAGRALDVPRVSAVVEVTQAILAACQEDHG